MEVFIRNLDSRATKDKIDDWLKPILEKYEIHVFDLRKRKGKSFASLTIADSTKAKRLIHGATSFQDLPPHPHTRKMPSFLPGRDTPDPMLLRALRNEELQRAAPRMTKSDIDSNDLPSKSAVKQQNTPLQISSFACGRWSIENDRLVFVPFYSLTADGVLVKRGRGLILQAECLSSNSHLDVVFEHIAIQSIVVVNQVQVVLTVALAPKIYEQPSLSGILLEQDLLRALGIDTEQLNYRKSTLPHCDEAVAGACLVYCINVRASHNNRNLLRDVELLTQKRFPLWHWKQLGVRKPGETFSQQVERLQQALELQGLSYETRFQIQALWSNTLLSPSEVQKLLPELKLRRDQGHTERHIAASLRCLTIQLPAVEPGYPLSDAETKTPSKLLAQYVNTISFGNRANRGDEVAIHRALVTPAGLYLYGPDGEPSNRVIRQYAEHVDCFIRVSFADESGDRIQFDIDASNEKIFRGKFLRILQNGLPIAGDHFEFLGFSHSSLRSQTCWFMRPFMQHGKHIRAQSVIKSLGDFTHIQCPAKCAARIGQAFSDTMKGTTIDAASVVHVDDIKRGRFTFTDGCGTISQELCQALAKSSSGTAPTLFQIRYRGAKGMVSLDTRLSGYQMRLRPSMIKFTGSSSNDIEICGMNTRPLQFKLNRQITKILEDLGISYETFQELQDKALKDLRRNAVSAESAIGFLCFNLTESSTGISDLIKCLVDIGIDVTEDEFIRSIIRALIEVQLRDLKFRGRIAVEKAVTLYGICDETSFLESGQVYVTFQDESVDQTCLLGRIAVTRSPALHPGDIQIVEAVAVPPDSPLRDLTNCIVFSQKGDRDMPSMLSGGDLDGDIFNIIFDSNLIPPSCDAPAEYQPVQPIDIGRPVTSDDMAEFFVNFMESDQLGRIATLHQVYADRSANGTRSIECLKLAKLHSDAVDFSKSGRPVNLKDIPKTLVARPDFMVPSVSTKIHRGVKEAEQDAEANPTEHGNYRYYESEHALGKLFRSIDEDEFFTELQDDNISIFSREGQDDVVHQIWDWVNKAAPSDDWQDPEVVVVAQQVKDYYNTVLLDIMSQYAVGNTQSITEKEVMIGTIIKAGYVSGRQRDQSDLMKARYKREVQDVRSWMKTQTDNDPQRYLMLAIACLSLCVSKPTSTEPHFGDHLRSFAWFAAALCVPKFV